MSTHIINTTTPIRQDGNQVRVNRQQQKLFKYTQAIWLVIAIIEICIAFRFIFEATGANAYNSFVNLILTVSYPFAAPFMGIFGSTYTPRSFVDWSLLVAALVYYLLGLCVIKLVQVMMPVPPQRETYITK